MHLICLRMVLASAMALCSPPKVAKEARIQINGHGFAPVNGTRLYYEVSGQGEPLVLIHGGMLDSRMWDEQFAEFARRYRVVRYDVRGFGGSIQPEGRPYSDADDLAALLDYLDIREAHLVGLSLGGRIALDFAVAQPKRVQSLLLAGAGLAGFEKPDPEGEERWFARVREAQNGHPEKAMDMWLSDAYMAPAMENHQLAPRLRYLAYENAHNWLENPILQHSPRPLAAKRLGEIKAPTLVVLGERDVPRAHEVGEALLKGIAGSKKVVIPGAGHMVSMEKPEEFNRAMLEFLHSLPSGPGK